MLRVAPHRRSAGPRSNGRTRDVNSRAECDMSRPAPRATFRARHHRPRRDSRQSGRPHGQSSPYDPRHSVCRPGSQTRAQLRILCATREREAQPDQRIEQPVLCQFELAPEGRVAAERKIGDRPVVPAASAERLRRVSRDQPVARIRSQNWRRSGNSGWDTPAHATHHLPAPRRDSSPAAGK